MMRVVSSAALSAALATGCTERPCDPEAAMAMWTCAGDCGAPGTLAWARTYQGGISAGIGEVALDACGGLFAVGVVAPDRTAEAREALALRYDASGELDWLQVTEAFGDDFAAGAAATPDGGVVVVGQTLGRFTNWNEIDYDTWVARYEVDGTIAWQRTFDDGEHGWATDVVIDHRGQAVVIGRGGIRWLDGDGEVIRTIEPSNQYGPSRIAAARDGRLAVIDGEVLRMLADDGAEVWRRPGRPIDMAFLSDGTLVMLGESTLEGIDAAGMSRWIGTIPQMHEFEWLSGMAIDADDRITLAGTEIVDGERRAWVAALGGGGEVEWRWSLASVVSSESTGVIAGPDGSVIVTARLDRSSLTGSIDQDVWLGRIYR